MSESINPNLNPVRHLSVVPAEGINEKAEHTVAPKIDEYAGSLIVEATVHPIPAIYRKQTATPDQLREAAATMQQVAIDRARNARATSPNDVRRALIPTGSPAVDAPKESVVIEGNFPAKPPIPAKQQLARKLVKVFGLDKPQL